MMAATAVLLFFWVFSLLALFFFVAMPYITRSGVCRWPRAARSQQETVDAPTQTADTRQLESEEYHYAVSRAQEEEIRESYLLDMLRRYSKKLGFDDIKDGSASPDTTSSDDSSTDSSPSDCHSSSPRLDLDVEMGDNDVDENEKDGNDESSIDDFVELIEDSVSSIHVPAPGQETASDDDIESQLREVPNGCAICLSLFKPDDNISWSSNPDCSHVFHHDCVLHWLKSSRKKKSRRQADGQILISDSVDPIKWLTRGSMACPCCRREFIIRSAEPDDETLAENTNETDADLQSHATDDDSLPTTATTVSDGVVNGASQAAILSC